MRNVSKILDASEKLAVVKANVMELVCEMVSLSCDDVKENSNLEEDLGYSDLDKVELSMAIEEGFEIDMPDEDLDKIKTVSDLIGYVKSKLGLV
jgi:acyl carrier protein